MSQTTSNGILKVYKYPLWQVLAIESINKFIDIIWNEISQWIQNKTAYFFVFYTKYQNMLSISKEVEQYCFEIDILILSCLTSPIAIKL